MQYLRIEHLQPDMVLAKSIIGENGSLLVKDGNKISPTILKRMIHMGFQGAYIDTPGFSDIVVEDVIPDEIRMRAFDALRNGNMMEAVQTAKQIVKELKYKETLKLDLLDIKNDKNYLFKHCVSVAVFAVVIGVGMGLNEDQLENLAVAGLLHDIGELEIKKKVLHAKHIYDKKEMDEMKKHPANGYELLKEYPFISSVSRNSVLFHHENLDGSGYYGITEERLGIFPRILRVADTYDAMTAKKKYRNAVAPAAVIEYIMSGVDKIFDHKVVEVFVKKFPVYPIGFTLSLSNGEQAVVVSNEYNAIRPRVRTLDGRDVDLALDADYRSVLIEKML